MATCIFLHYWSFGTSKQQVKQGSSATGNKYTVDIKHSVSLYLFGGFWVEGLSDNEGTVDTQCVRDSTEAFQF